jgi:beta-phosphoglucomutase-like phosphatase (HAD superfamily)
MKAVFVDLDGTLVDSLPSLYQTYKAFLEQFGLTHSQNEFETLNGLTLEEVVSTIERNRGLKLDSNQLSLIYRKGVEERYGSPPVFPFAKEVLAFLKAYRVSIYIVTSAKKALVDKIVQKQNLTPFIDGIVTAEGLLHGKPFPDIYLKALEVAKVDPQDVFVIEDALNGINAAKRAGLEVFSFDPKSNDWRAFLKELKKKGSFVHPQFEITPLTDSFKVLLEETPLSPLSEEEEKRMESVWEAQKIKSGDRLTNGERLTYLLFEKMSLKGVFAPYKRVLSFGGGVAVTGITKTEDGAVLIAQRSTQVASFPGFFELAPAGGLDPSCLKGEEIDYKKQIEIELKEELDISSSFLKKNSPLFLIEDKELKTFEIVMELTLSEKLGALSWEYEELHWIESEARLSFLAKHFEKIVPLSRILLTRE